ncbi:hypothetical protein [Streptomyces hygroscopicus]|uniref:hypothetical protein n=1 Tax=Streptomyces hygroscopicus TaxID=1912 RepID=UPI003A0FCB93
MRMLVGLSSPDTGSASILGEPVGLGVDVLRAVGVLIDGPAFVPHGPASPRGYGPRARCPQGSWLRFTPLGRWLRGVPGAGRGMTAGASVG